MTNQGSILLVEDEADIRKAVAFRLKSAGFHVVTAEDGEMGLRLAREMRPDLVVLDLMLPKLPGEEVCKSIREDEDPEFSATPIIMLTAKGEQVDQIIGKVLGANCYMVKPFEIDELIRNIRRLKARPV